MKADHLGVVSGLQAELHRMKQTSQDWESERIRGKEQWNEEKRLEIEAVRQEYHDRIEVLAHERNVAVDEEREKREQLRKHLDVVREELITASDNKVEALQKQMADNEDKFSP